MLPTPTLPRGTRVCAGFSGGLDSVVLIDALDAARAQSGIVLSAVHVHHGLSPNADAWAAFCEDFCAKRRIPIAIERVRVQSGGRGLEAAARAARYQAYARQQADFIALAHHQDDQAETVLLQLLRGTGLKGVAAMPALRELPATKLQLYRPFLDVPRSSLFAHAKSRGLDWIEDESNASIAYDRNFLRREVVPRLEERFPAWRDSLARFAGHAADAQLLLRLLAREDGVPDAAGEALADLRSDDPARRANALRAFLDVNRLPMPSEARLAEMARQLFDARRDAQVRVEHGGVALVRHRGEIRIDRDREAQSGWSVAWHGEAELPLGPGRGVIRFAESEGQGIRADSTRTGPWRFAPRAGGERLRLDARRPNRALKSLLQESGIPAWQRPRLPLLFHGDDLVWVPGIGIAEAWQCPPGAKGRVPEWFFPASA